MLLGIASAATHVTAPAFKYQFWRAVLSECRAHLRNCDGEIERVARSIARDFDTELLELKSAKTQFLSSQKQEKADIQKLHARAWERQMEEHLERHFIRAARVEGIGIGRVSVLESYGIETAFDVKREVVSHVPGFGDVLVTRLVEWRRDVEKQFRFNPVQAVSKADAARIKLGYALHRSTLEQRLVRGKVALEQLLSKAKSEAERLYPTKHARLLEVSQAVADVTACQ